MRYETNWLMHVPDSCSSVAPLVGVRMMLRSIGGIATAMQCAFAPAHRRATFPAG
jgi:hypothetical protein